MKHIATPITAEEARKLTEHVHVCSVPARVWDDIRAAAKEGKKSTFIQYAMSRNERDGLEAMGFKTFITRDEKESNTMIYW